MLSPLGNSLKDSFVVKAYEIMNYTAVNIGDQEFSNGVSFFDSVVRKADLPLVSASLKMNGEQISPSFIKVPINGLIVTVIGVVSKDAFFFMNIEKWEGIEVKEHTDVISKVLKQIKDESSLIILLSHLGYEEDKAIARKFPEIDIIVGGHSQTKLESPELVGETIIVQAGEMGHYLGRLDLGISEDRKILTYSGELIPLTADMPDDPEIMKKVVLYDEMFSKAEGLKRSYISLIPEGFDVISGSECKPCHEIQYVDWEKTDHRGAFDVLMEKLKFKNPECLSCHTTGYGRDDGYTTLAITPGLTGVGCTECHYLNRRHIENPSKITPEKISINTCTRCHTSFKSPDFNFGKYIEKVDHREAKLTAGERKEFVRKPAVADERYYIVRKGDSLSLIAQKIFGDFKKWNYIFELNRDIITNPDLIYPGQKIRISEN